MRTVCLRHEFRWGTFPSENGDIDVKPLGEIHLDGICCTCKPEVIAKGAYLVFVHHAFDHREIVEQAINIMNEAAGVK